MKALRSSLASQKAPANAGAQGSLCGLAIKSLLEGVAQT